MEEDRIKELSKKLERINTLRRRLEDTEGEEVKSIDIKFKNNSNSDLRLNDYSGNESMSDINKTFEDVMEHLSSVWKGELEHLESYIEKA